MDQTLAPLVFLFDKEKLTYDTIFRSHIFLAMQVGKDLINRSAVDPSPMLAPALKPFNLTALPVDGDPHQPEGFWPHLERGARIWRHPGGR